MEHTHTHISVTISKNYFRKNNCTSDWKYFTMAKKRDLCEQGKSHFENGFAIAAAIAVAVDTQNPMESKNE